MTKRKPITAHDLMDATEVAEAFGVERSSIQVAMSAAGPRVTPSLTRRLPAPLRKVGKAWVWSRADVEAALR